MSYLMERNLKAVSSVLLLLLVLASFTICLSRVKSAQKLSISQPKAISLIQLIATPEKFDGQLISVTGFLGMEKEDTRLYVSEEDYKQYIPQNGVWVDANKQMMRDIEKIDLHYVVLVGVFKEKGLPLHFPGGGGQGGISDVRQCSPWLTSTERRPRMNGKE